MLQLKDPGPLDTDAYVHGERRSANSGKRFDVEDPGTGRVFASCPDFDESDVDSVILSSHEAFQTYRRENPRSRATKLFEWHRLIQENKNDLACLLTYETGKPLAEAYAEIDYASGFTWWFAGEAERVRGNISIPSAPNRRLFVVKQPIGVCVALVPWNFPMAMILRKVGAALAAGCTMIAKPSPETPLTTLALARLAGLAGFGPGVFNVVTTSLKNTPAVSEALCKHPLVKKVSFTGSTGVGSIIAKHCAEGIKKVTLELGEIAHFSCSTTVIKSRHWSSCCFSSGGMRDRPASPPTEYTYKRVFTKSSSPNSRNGLGISKWATVSTKKTTMGPVTTARSVSKAQAHVEDAVANGAKIVLGGKPGKERGMDGYFFEPTILRDMNSRMLITREETFGPILAVYSFRTEEEVVQWSNDTSMGLASYFFTKNVDRTWRLLETLEAGMIGMNTGNSSAAESPFGGIKASGYGKESGKDVAVEEYLISKTGTMTLEDHF